MMSRGTVSSNTQQAIARVAEAPLRKISQATSEQLTAQRHCHIPGFRCGDWFLTERLCQCNDDPLQAFSCCTHMAMGHFEQSYFGVLRQLFVVVIATTCLQALKFR